MGSIAIAGFIFAAFFAYLSVRFLTTYFETKTLKPFALYCVIAGTVAFALLTLGI
jgi:undecaprenyl-diphosphatase